MPTTGTVKNIQALRFYAALAVLLFHVSSIYNHYSGQLFAPWSVALDPVGKAGVDVFFVISGFVIWVSTDRHHYGVDALPFALRRLARILITYWPALIFAVLVDIYIRQRGLTDANLWASISLFPLEFRSTGRLLLPVSWTLTFELMFYLVFALLMFLPRKAALAAMVLWGAASLVLAKGTFLSPFIAEFAAGCLLGYVVPHINLERISLTALAFTMGVLLFGGAAHGEDQWWRVVWFGSFGVVAVLTAVCMETRGIVAPKWSVTMGEASYALYLLHFPILQAFASYWQILKIHPEMILPVIPLSLVASLA